MAELTPPPGERGIEPGVMDLKRGDIAYIVNGTESNLAKVNVEDVYPEDDRIEVWHLAKQERMTFVRSTAHPPAEIEFKHYPPTLVPKDDWRVAVLVTKDRFRKLGVEVQERFSMFMKDPTDVNGDALMAATVEWTSYALYNSQRAIVSGSIQEYLFAADPGKDRRERPSKYAKEVSKT